MSRADERSTLRSPKPDGFATKSSLKNKRPGLSGRPLCKGVAIGPRGEGPTERYYFVVGRHLLSFRLFAFFFVVISVNHFRARMDVPEKGQLGSGLNPTKRSHTREMLHNKKKVKTTKQMRAFRAFAHSRALALACLLACSSPLGLGDKAGTMAGAYAQGTPNKQRFSCSRSHI